MEFKKLIFILSCIFFSLTSWNYTNIHIIGDSNSAYCYTSRPHILPGNNAPKPNTPKYTTYETYPFSYQVTPSEIVDLNFAIHWVLERTMHRIGRDGIEDFNIKSYGVEDNDVVVFMFGAIDIGSHIFRNDVLRHVIAGRDLDEIINTLVSSYMKTIIDNQKMYKNLTVVIQAVIPYLTNPHPTYINQFHAAFPLQDFVSYQVNVNRKLNQKLKEYCKKNNFLFLNINHLYQNEQGALRPEFSDGIHHINPKFNPPFKENLIQLLLNALK